MTSSTGVIVGNQAFASHFLLSDATAKAHVFATRMYWEVLTAQVTQSFPFPND